MSLELSLKETIQKNFGIELPISGGWGGSIEDAIKIDKEYKDWSDVMYTCLRLINRMLGRGWKLVKQTTVEKDGKTFDQMKLEIEGDSNNYYNYYFDISDHLDAPLFSSETAWPEDILKKTTNEKNDDTHESWSDKTAKMLVKGLHRSAKQKETLESGNN